MLTPDREQNNTQLFLGGNFHEKKRFHYKWTVHGTERHQTDFFFNLNEFI